MPCGAALRSAAGRELGERLKGYFWLSSHFSHADTTPFNRRISVSWN